MTLRWYDGHRNLRSEPHVRLYPRGRIYIGSVLVEALGRPESVRIGFDDKTRQLVIRPAVDGDKRVFRSTRKTGSIVVSCRNALKYFGLLGRSGRYTATISNGQILATLGDGEPKDEASLPASRHVAAPHAERESERKPRGAIEPELDHDGQMIDISQVCQLTQVSRRSVTNWMAAGTFPKPADTRGKANLWRRADIEQWLAGRTEGPEAAGQEMLDVVAVAKRIGCTQTTLYTRISRGEFPRPTHKRGLKNLWVSDAVERWMQGKASRQEAVGNKGEEVKETARPGAATCSTCADNKGIGRTSFCRSEVADNPKRNTMVQPTDGCEHHRKPGTYRPMRADDEE